jgi:hypothetical protein
MQVAMFDVETPSVGWAQLEELAAAERQRDEAIAQAEANADVEWRDTALRFLRRYAEAHTTVFVDDLWAAGMPRPREARALGAVMKRAAREGLIENTGSGRPSIASNLAMKPVWRSLVTTTVL